MFPGLVFLQREESKISDRASAQPEAGNVTFSRAAQSCFTSTVPAVVIMCLERAEA